MSAIRLLAAPVRRLANSRLIQLAVVIAIILALDHYSYDNAVLRPLAEGLKGLVTASVQLFSDYFRIGILTDPVLQVALMIVYVYAICLLMFWLLRIAAQGLVDVAGRANFLWLRNTIARERGIAAYRAWLPLERIRPPECPQEKWEELYAWPLDNKPPYLPLGRRILHASIAYLAVLIAAAILLQLFTPLPVLSWLWRLI